MLDEEKRTLSAVRIEHAEECLSAAKSAVASGSYRSAANRSYYTVFHAMRAVLALNGIDMKHHSGIISEFRRLYIKTGVFDKEMSKIINELFDVRTMSDYNDFFVLSKADVEEQVRNAELFLSKVKLYLTP
ncbi:MAG: HEPN domain-containing protein [bacterium]